jgi:hypothetical protein
MSCNGNCNQGRDCQCGPMTTMDVWAVWLMAFGSFGIVAVIAVVATFWSEIASLL